MRNADVKVDALPVTFHWIVRLHYSGVSGVRSWAALGNEASADADADRDYGELRNATDGGARQLLDIQPHVHRSCGRRSTQESGCDLRGTRASGNENFLRVFPHPLRDQFSVCELAGGRRASRGKIALAAHRHDY